MCGQIFNLIQAYAFPRDLFKYLFCFAHHKALLSKGHVDLVSPGAGWDLYDPEVGGSNHRLITHDDGSIPTPASWLPRCFHQS